MKVFIVEVRVELKLLRELFQAGVLKEVYVTPAPMAEDVWILLIERINGPREVMTTQRGGEKMFKTLPGAMEDVRRIGFREARVMLPNEKVPIKKR